MPNIHLTAPMQDYAQSQIASGAYANLSEVVRAGMRLLMEQDGARFYAFKAQRQFASSNDQSDVPDAAGTNAERRRQAAEGLRAMMKAGSPISDEQLKELREHGRR